MTDVIFVLLSARYGSPGPQVPGVYPKCPGAPPGHPARFPTVTFAAKWAQKQLWTAAKGLRQRSRADLLAVFFKHAAIRLEWRPFRYGSY